MRYSTNFDLAKSVGGVSSLEGSILSSFAVQTFQNNNFVFFILIVEYVEVEDPVKVCCNRYSLAVDRRPSGRLPRAHTGARGAMPESCLGERPGDRTLPPSPPHTCAHSLLHVDSSNSSELIDS